MKKKLLLHLSAVLLALSSLTTACDLPVEVTLSDYEQGYDDSYDYENDYDDSEYDLEPFEYDEVNDSDESDRNSSHDNEKDDNNEAEENDSSEETVSYTFRRDSYLTQHYEKHGIEMGFASEEEYLAAANAVIQNPNALHKLEEEDDDHVYFIEDTNEIVFLSQDGYIRSYFICSGIAYFNRT